MKTFRLLSLILALLAFMMFQEMCKKKDGTQVVAVLNITPTSGTLTTVFTFDGSASHDGNNSAAGLMYRWDADSDGNWDIDWTAISIIDVTFSAVGTFLVTMEVKSTPDNTATDSKQVTVTGGGGLPTVTTTNATNITQTTATSGGNVTDPGSSSVIFRGVCWSTGTNPTILNSLTVDGSGTGSFTSNITGLTSNTTYYVRAYATNTSGTAYGSQVSFTTLGGGTGTVTDIDGNIYNTLTIGTQIWLRENLKTTHFSDGTSIPLVGDNTAWSYLPTPAYCWYNNDPSTFGNTYGALYNWHSVNAGNLCPTGWHVATRQEWVTLTTYAGGPAVAGGKLKEAGTEHWLSPNTGATNELGFTALPGGLRNDWDGLFQLIGSYGEYWTSTQLDLGSSWYNSFSWENTSLSTSTRGKSYGLSVRCIKD